MPRAFDYARARRTADRLIARFSQGPAMLHVITTDSDGAGGTIRTQQDIAVKAVRLDYDSRYRVQAGIPDTDARVLIARAGLARDVTLDCEVTVEGERFRIVPPIRRDPANAMWDLQVRPA